MRPKLPLLSVLLLLRPVLSASPSPSPESTTLIDALSADPDFTLFLRLVQRAKLVPTFNQINGSTLFAPTNDAIKQFTQKDASSVWQQSFRLNSDIDQEDELIDNVQHELRQHIFYHVLNYTLDAFPNQDAGPAVHQTLHFPAKAVEPPSRQPPPNPPWMPVPGGLLGGEPQRLRLASAADESKWVGVDAAAKGGSKVVKDVIKVGNGNIFAVDQIIRLPGDLADEVARHPGLSTFAKFIPEKLNTTLKEGEHLTLFFPVNEAWDALDPIERRYLESGFAENDVAKIVGLHTSGSGSDGRGRVGWSENWEKDGLTNFTTLQGHTLKVNSSDETVSGREIVNKDIYAANGVLHVVSQLLLSPDIFKLNAEKYMLALNATTFVSLLRASNMSHYVDDEHDGKAWTILAPLDDVFTHDPTMTRWSNDGPAAGFLSGFVKGEHNDTAKMEKILKYHFIPGKLKPEDLEDGGLLGTELTEEGLKGGRQKLQVTVNGRSRADQPGPWTGNGGISFGGATVIRDAVEIGDTIIYVISKVLEPPTDAIEAALPSPHLSTFLTSVFATHSEEQFKTHPLTTILVPHNSAWGPLGLLTNYLLLPEARKDLEQVVKHHVLEEVIYARDSVLASTGQKGGSSRTYRTLEGSDVRVESGKVTSSGGWVTDIHIHPEDILTKTGVMHEIKGNSVLIPRSVNVNVGDLAKAGKGSVMIGLVQKAGFGGVLNGTKKLDLDEWEHDHRLRNGHETKRKEVEVGWTLLCPTDEAFQDLNLTALLEDQEQLVRIVRQHLIPVPPSTLSAALAQEAQIRRKKLPAAIRRSSPVTMTEENPNRPLPFFDDATFQTMLTPWSDSLHGDIVFRATGSNPNSFLVGIRGTKGPNGVMDYARILNYGRTTTSPGRQEGHSGKGGSNDEGTQTPMVFSVVPDEGVETWETNMRSGVILIDRPLSPYTPTWWEAWGPAVALGVFGSIVILGGHLWLVIWWRRKGEEPTFEPIGVREDD